MQAPFHMAFPVNSIGITKMFYHEVVGCPVGRESKSWIDFDFFGNQISAHVSEVLDREIEESEVDGRKVPLNHFGAIVSMERWLDLKKKFKVSGTEFIHEPFVRYQGKKEEQHVMFVSDPSGNALEFKAFTNLDAVFNSDD